MGNIKKYDDLEISVLSCLLCKPELMNQVILDDKYFIKHKKIWIFLKAFYNKFHNFDLTLMYSISKDKYRIVQYIIWLVEQEPDIRLFNEYQKQLIYLYEESKKEKWIIEKIYGLANELYVRNINTNEFKEKVKNIYDNADEIFKEE